VIKVCGIIGVIGKVNLGKTLFNGIKNLEYRGYDSVGMATLKNGSISIKKDIGNIDEANKKVNFLDISGTVGIAHWIVVEIYLG